MVKLLHVAVSPLNERSFSARIAAEFVNSWKERNPNGTVDSFNLWSEPLPPFDAVGASWKNKMMGGDDPDAAEQALFARVKAVVDRFLAADQYLLSVPMWNLHIPYPLKHFIDVIVQLGLTFGFDQAGGTVGLVPSERPVQLVLTRGGMGYGSGGPLDGLDHQEPYLRKILHFIGLTDVRSIVAEGTAYGPQVAEPALERALIEARAAARDFGRHRGHDYRDSDHVRVTPVPAAALDGDRERALPLPVSRRGVIIDRRGGRSRRRDGPGR